MICMVPVNDVTQSLKIVLPSVLQLIPDQFSFQGFQHNSERLAVELHNLGVILLCLSLFENRWCDGIFRLSLFLDPSEVHY